MKTNILYLLLLLLLTSQIGIGQKNQKYTIRGTLPDKSFDGSYVKLEKDHLSSEKGNFTIDSAKIKNGKFIIKGKAEKEPFMSYVYIPGSITIGHLIIEPGEIQLIRSSEYIRNVSGTPINDEYNKNVRIPFQVFLQADTLRAKKEKAMKEETWTEDDEIYYQSIFPMELFQNYKDKELDFIESHLQYPEVVVATVRMYYEMCLNEEKTTGRSSEKTERIRNILSRLPEKTAARIYQAHDALEKKMAEYLKKNPSQSIYRPKEIVPEEVQVGKIFSDFSGETVDGKTIVLSEIVKANKLVLIDFWASWCGPCLKEMPAIVGLYKEYKDKGLEVLGISSDEESRRWKDALQKNNMTWLQIRSDSEDRIGMTYGIKYIPYTILIDQNGIIVARRLRGEQLQQKIKELLE